MYQKKILARLEREYLQRMSKMQSKERNVPGQHLNLQGQEHK